MRKRYCMGFILALVLAAALFYQYYTEQNSVVLQIGEGIPYVDVNMQQSTNKVGLWQDEEDGKSYFFLPSCVDHHKVKVGDLGTDGLQIAGERYEAGDVFTWEDDTEYMVTIVGESYEVRNYAVTFMKSANIPSIFINTQSGNMEYVNEQRHNLESGDICVILANGMTEYQNVLPKIVSRGNVSWNRPKKPYTIKLEDKYPLCGLRKGG